MGPGGGRVVCKRDAAEAGRANLPMRQQVGGVRCPRQATPEGGPGGWNVERASLNMQPIPSRSGLPEGNR